MQVTIETSVAPFKSKTVDDRARRTIGQRAKHALRARPRLTSAASTVVLLLIVLPAAWPRSTRLLAAWDTGVLLYLALAWTLMLRSGINHMRRRAAQQDEGEFLVLALTLVAAIVSLGAIVAELHAVRAAPSGEGTWRIALAAATILCSWFFVHTIFALHYAHEFYAPTDEGRRESLRFPEHLREPGYGDFLYVSFTIGAACQTADVSMASPRIRRVVLAHTVFSFLFNTMVLALAVNVGAGLV